MKTRSAWIGLLLLSFVAGGCAASTSPGSDVTDDDLTASSASKTLSGQLFADKDPSEAVDYVLLGTLPKSTEACEVVVARRGLKPKKDSWSKVSIHPLGASADKMEANGPVEIDWATTRQQSHDKDAIKTTGDVTVYTRTSAPSDDHPTKMTLTLTFTPSETKHYDHVSSAAIQGNDVAGDKAASCENLKPAIVLRPSEYEPTANAAMHAWEKDNDENLGDLGVELEGCSLSSPTTVGCDFGNDTNEERLFIEFELKNGKLGKVVKADRSSDS